MRRRDACIRVAALAVLLGTVWAARAQSLDFVQVSDTHLSALEGVHPGIAATLSSKRNAAERLAAALRSIGEGYRPAFVLATGDLVEGYQFEGVSGQTVRGQVELFAAIASRSRVPVMPVLGNYDITGYRPGGEKAVGNQAVAPEARRAWSGTMAAFRGGTYYSFERKVGRTSYLFLVLDDGETPSRDPAFAAAQIGWLKDELQTRGSGPAIVALHVPLSLPGQKPTIAQGIQEALATSRRVALILAGHRHSDAVETVDLHGRAVTQVRTAAMFLRDTNWRRFRLLENRIEVYATGRPRELAAAIPVPMAAAVGR